MAKTIEMYVTYLSGKDARVRRADLKRLVKMAGLYLHRPDKGTGVVVIHAYKDRSDPRQYSKKVK